MAQRSPRQHAWSQFDSEWTVWSVIFVYLGAQFNFIQNLQIDCLLWKWPAFVFCSFSILPTWQWMSVIIFVYLGVQFTFKRNLSSSQIACCAYEPLCFVHLLPTWRWLLVDWQGRFDTSRICSRLETLLVWWRKGNWHLNRAVDGHRSINIPGDFKTNNVSICTYLSLNDSRHNSTPAFHLRIRCALMPWKHFWCADIVAQILLLLPRFYECIFFSLFDVVRLWMPNAT